jgi:hypothetical protein
VVRKLKHNCRTCRVISLRRNRAIRLGVAIAEDFVSHQRRHHSTAQGPKKKFKVQKFIVQRNPGTLPIFSENSDRSSPSTLLPPPHQKPGTRNQEPGTRNPRLRPGTRNWEPGSLLPRSVDAACDGRQPIPRQPAVSGNPRKDTPRRGFVVGVYGEVTVSNRWIAASLSTFVGAASPASSSSDRRARSAVAIRSLSRSNALPLGGFVL